MELSAPLRWLGALAIMLVVVLIVVPMLLDTVTDTIVFGEDASEPAAAADGTPSEVASEAVASGDGGGNQGGGNQGGGNQGRGGNQGADGDFPTTYTVVAGDTGTKISEQFYDSPDGWALIAQANDIDPYAPLRVGLELTIPAPE
ncbi:MAG TPA: LysM domain-containing protein [Euzebyales bacterium]